MDTERIMRTMDASYRTRRTIEQSLREIDRRALNAMVLVKRHGKTLAGYGVIAHAFREQAVHLKEAAGPLQQAIVPLVHLHMRTLQHGRHAELFRRAAAQMKQRNAYSTRFDEAENTWRQHIETEETESRAILMKLIEAVARLQEGITEQEYVVTNGRIEAALLEQVGAPLMRVSNEMGLAVNKVREAIWKYRNELEEVLNENSAGL